MNVLSPSFLGIIASTQRSSSGTDVDAVAFLVATGISDSTISNAINNLVIGLKVDGLWDKMKFIYPFVGGTSSTHKYNLKNPLDTDAAFRLVFSGTWTHSANGAKPGVDGYADTYLFTNLVLSTDSVHASIYVTENIEGGSDGIDLGAYEGPDNSLFLSAREAAYSGNPITRNLGAVVSGTGTDARGFLISTKTSATQTDLYKAGLNIGSGVSGGGLVVTGSIYLGCLNLGGAPYAVSFSQRNLALASCGDGLTGGDAVNYNTIIEAFETELSRNV